MYSLRRATSARRGGQASRAVDGMPCVARQGHNMPPAPALACQSRSYPWPHQAYATRHAAVQAPQRWRLAQPPHAPG